MDSKQQEIRENFSRNFKAVEYMEVSRNVFWKAFPRLFRFMIMSVHDAFRSGRFQGSKLLEIGSGASVHAIASASLYFENIVMSDYVEDNVEELKKWLNGHSSIKQFLDVQAGLEGYGNDLESGIKIIEDRIRRKVKRVTRCDLLNDHILLEKDTNTKTSPPFDVIVSCLCLEVAAIDVKGYTTNLKRINRLLRPGGGLLLAGFLEAGVWNIGNKQFHEMHLKQNDLLYALSEAGFGVNEMQIMDKDKDTTYEDTFTKMYFLVAKKLKDVFI